MIWTTTTRRIMLWLPSTILAVVTWSLLSSSPLQIVTAVNLNAIDKIGSTYKNVQTIFKQPTISKIIDEQIIQPAHEALAVGAANQSNHHSEKLQLRSLQLIAAEEDDSGTLVTRCFTECREQNMTPAECQSYIQQELSKAGGHEVGDVSIKIHVPRTSEEMKDSYWMVEVPVNLRHQMTCDRNNAYTYYPFEWLDGTLSKKVQDVNCQRKSAGECCVAIRNYGKTLTTSGGYDSNGNCLACFVHQETLVPIVEDGTTKYVDYHEFSNGVCAKELFDEQDVDAMDALNMNKITSAITALSEFQSTPTCDDFDVLLKKLYDAAVVIPPLSQKIGELACQVCYGSKDKVFTDPSIQVLIASMLNLLNTANPPSSKENCIIIYTDSDGKIVDDPKLGGSRADEPYETEDCDDNDENGPGPGLYNQDPNDPQNINTCINDPSLCRDQKTFCTFSEFKGYYCKDYANVGDRCGGVTIPGDENRCVPLQAFCDDGPDYCYSNVAEDTPGTCVKFGEGGFCDIVDDPECIDDDYCDVRAERCKPRRHLDECCDPDYFNSCHVGLSCVETLVMGNTKTTYTCRPECASDEDCSEDEFCTLSGGPDGPPSFCKPYASTGDGCDFFTTPQFIQRCNPNTHFCRDTRYCYIADVGGTCTLLGNECTSNDDCSFASCLAIGCPPPPPSGYCDTNIGRCKPKVDAGECCIPPEEGGSEGMCAEGTSCRVANRDDEGNDGPFPGTTLCRKDKGTTNPPITCNPEDERSTCESNQYCNFSEVNGYECKNYVGIGESCGGPSIPGEDSRCNPAEAVCSGDPGVCEPSTDVCSPRDESSCGPNQYCNFSEVNGYECKNYVGIGESCGGVTIPGDDSRCNPNEAFCNNGDNGDLGICEPLSECTLEDDDESSACGPNQYCNFSEIKNGYVCKNYVKIGESCGGVTIPGEDSRCNPKEAVCIGDPGICEPAECSPNDLSTCGPNQYCNFSEVNGYECKDYVGIGESCGGPSIPGEDSRCNPKEAVCTGDPGVCEPSVCSPKDESSSCGPNQYCNFSEVRGYECKDYAAPGDPCGGFTIVGEDSRCNPETAFCADDNQCQSFIADGPGKCVLFGTNMCDKGMEDNCADDEWCDLELKRCKPNVGKGECCIPDLNNCGIGDELGSLVCAEVLRKDLDSGYAPLCVPTCDDDNDCDNNHYCTLGGQYYNDGTQFCKPYQKTGGACLFYAAGPGYQEKCNPQTHFCWNKESCFIPDIGGTCELYRNKCTSDVDCDDAPATEWCDETIGYCKPKASPGDCCTKPDSDPDGFAPCMEGSTCTTDDEVGYLICVDEDGDDGGNGNPSICTFEDDSACGPNQYCNFSERNGYECKDYVKVGDFCGGFTLIGEDSRCNPDEAFCFNREACYSLIADAPGNCVAYGDGGFCDAVDDPACSLLDEWCDLDENRCKKKVPMGECCDEKIQNCGDEKDKRSLTCVPLYFTGISEPQFTCRLVCKDDGDCNDGEWCTGEFCKPYADTGEACDFFAAGPSFFERCNPDTHYCRSTQTCTIPDLGGTCFHQGIDCTTDEDCSNPSKEWCDTTVGYCKDRYDLGDCCDLEFAGSMCREGSLCSTGEELVLSPGPGRKHRTLLRSGNVGANKFHPVDRNSKITERNLEFIGTPICRDNGPGGGGGINDAPNCMKIGTQYTCGGFIGAQCPCICGDSVEEDAASGLDVVCVDDPSDECDPLNGGADCIGICQCEKPKGEEEFCDDVIPSQQCGGFAGFPCTCDCKDGQEPICVDDPTDDCDPLKGGADCIGLCKCEEPPKEEFCNDIRPAQQCGGFAGFQCTCHCEDGQEPLCVDDPTDDCDPNKGGADCIGLCKCEEPKEEFCNDIRPAQQCGGFAGFQCTCGCKNGKEPLCVDDPSDDCDPDKGGADCIGLCQC